MRLLFILIFLLSSCTNELPNETISAKPFSELCPFLLNNLDQAIVSYSNGDAPEERKIFQNPVDLKDFVDWLTELEMEDGQKEKTTLTLDGAPVYKIELHSDGDRFEFFVIAPDWIKIDGYYYLSQNAYDGARTFAQGYDHVPHEVYDWRNDVWNPVEVK